MVFRFDWIDVGDCVNVVLLIRVVSYFILFLWRLKIYVILILFVCFVFIIYYCFDGFVIIVVFYIISWGYRRVLFNFIFVYVFIFVLDVKGYLLM